MKKHIIKILSAAALTTFFANDFLTAIPFADDGINTIPNGDISISEPLPEENTDLDITDEPINTAETELPTSEVPAVNQNVQFPEDNITVTDEVNDSDLPVEEEIAEYVALAAWEGNLDLMEQVRIETGINDITQVTYDDIRAIATIDLTGSTYPIPAILAEFTGLKNLNLTNNKLSQFPNSILSLSNLADLTIDISYNQIYLLPANYSANIIYTHTLIASDTASQLKLKDDSALTIPLNQTITQETLRNLVNVYVSSDNIETLNNDINLELIIDDKIVSPDELRSYSKGSYAAHLKINGADISNTAAITDTTLNIDLQGQSEIDANKVPLEAWEGCTPLMDSTCKYLNTSDIKDVTYDDLATIKYIDLLHGGLDSLPSIVSKYTNVEGINLVDNNFTEIPSEVFTLKKLTDLNMSQNKLASIPDEIDELVNLEMLTLENNDISNISNKISSLAKLRYLCLNSNKHLQNCLETIYTINSLEILFMHNCNLYDLGDNISNLTNLKVLQVCDNQLITAPSQGTELTNYTGNFISNSTNSYKQLTCDAQEKVFSKTDILSQDTLKAFIFALVKNWRGDEFEAINPNHILEFVVDNKIITGEELSKYPEGTYNAYLIIKGADLNNTAARTKDTITINIAGNTSKVEPATKPSSTTPATPSTKSNNNTTKTTTSKNKTTIKTTPKKNMPYTGSEAGIIMTILGSLSVGCGAFIFKNRKNKK